MSFRRLTLAAPVLFAAVCVAAFAADTTPTTAVGDKSAPVREQPAMEPTPPRSPAAEKFSPEAPLAFRRVFVPEAEIKDWPRGNLRFLPLDVGEFERLVERAQRTAPREAPPGDAEVVQAAYDARLVGDELVDGQATLEIKSLSKQPVFVALDPCRLAIESPEWTADAATAPQTSAGPHLAQDANFRGAKGDTAQPLALGIGADGKLALRIANSGRLRFAWSLQGQHETGGAVAFTLQLPRSPSNRLHLTLPAELVPVVDQAIVTALPATQAAPAKGAKGTKVGTVAALTRRWEIDLGGQNIAVLRVARQDLVHERRPLTLARQSLTYDFSPRGLQLSAELKLDVLGEPIQEIPLDLDSPLTLVTARFGDTQLAWSDAAAPPSDAAIPKVALDQIRTTLDDLGVPFPMSARSRRIVLRLPEPLRGSGRVLRLGAVAPLPSSGRLPSIRPATADFQWQEGNATLLVPLPLELSELRMEGCRQTKGESLSAPARGEAITLQYFRPEADVFVAIRRQPDRFQVQSGTMLDVRGTTISGRYTADLTAQEGECFSLAADVPASWIIDSVESLPAGGVATWSVDPAAGGAARLNVGLTKAIRVDRPLRLVVTGRWRRTPLGETLAGSDLSMLSFRDVKVGRRLVALRAATPYRLQVTGGENLTRLNPDRLDSADAALLGPSPGGTILVADGGIAGLSVAIGKEAPKFSGEIQLDVKLTDDTLAETYTFSCTPESAEIDRLLVHFSQARSGPLHWAMLAEDEPPLLETQEPIAAEKLTAADQAKLGFATGEVWNVTWLDPRGEPFKLRATRTTPLAATTPISLAALVQAASQHGTIEIRSAGEHVPEITNRRLKTAAIPHEAADHWPEILAAYQYEPQAEAIQAATNPLAALAIGPGKSLPDAWAWSVRVDSHFSPQGHSEHVGVWRIENGGRARIAFQMPSGTTFQAAWIDGTLAPAASSDAKSGRVDLELPPGRRFPLVVLKWVCDGPPLSILSSQSVEIPAIAEMPVLSRRVNLWLSPSYRLIDGEANPAASTEATVSWSQRLFGPLGRPPGESPFDPLRTDDWKNLIGSLSIHDRAWIEGQRFIERSQTALWPANSAAAREATTWGELLTRLQSEVAGERKEPPIPVFVDRRALADVGIVPRTVVSAPSAAANDRGLSPLDDADLMILAAPEALLLTTRSAATQWGTGESTAERSLCERIANAALRERLRAAATDGNARFVPIELWCLPEMKLPWTAGTRDPQPIDHAGWTNYHLESPVGDPVRFWLVRHDAIAGGGCALFLFAALLAWWKGRLSWKARGGIAAIVTLLALAIPGGLAPLGAGLWLGCMCGWSIRLFGIGDRPDAKRIPNAAATARVAGLRIGILLLVMAGVATKLAWSAEPAPATTGAATSGIYDVLIPTDDQQHPKGTECLVPEPLYDELYQRAGRATAVAQEWLITSAVYRGRLAREAGQVVAGGDWTAHYDLETFGRPAHVQIPFGGEGTNLVPDGVRLDGATIQFEWKNSGRSLAIDVPQAGQHQLELAFRPTPQTINSAMVVDMAVPALPSSRLQLEAPSDVQVEVPSAKGHLALDKAGSLIEGPLGPADRLTVRWGEAAALESKPAVADVDELLWLKIRPGSVVLETKFNLRVAEGRLREAELRADPRLRRLPLEAGSPIAQIRTEGSDTHTIYLGLAHPITDQVAFKMSFLLTDTSGIGNLQMPRLDLVGARSVTRRLAVSIEAPLEADEQQFRKLKSIPLGDFLSAWGPAETRPQLAFQLSDGVPSFAIHSREPQLASTDVLAVTFGRDRLDAAWMSDLTVQGGSIYQVPLTAPRQFHIESAALRGADGTDAPIRWSRNPLGGTTLFLPGPPAERYKLLVRGWMSSSPGKATPLPDLRVAGCQRDSQTVLALRKPSVLVTVSDRGGLVEQTAKDSQKILDRALADGLLDRASLATERLVTCLSGQPAAAAIAMRSTPNAPRVEGVQMTTIRREGDEWTASVDLDLQVSGGVLDSLRFDLPANWSVVSEVSPATPSEVIDVPGEGRKQLVLRPVEPIAGAQHFRLDGPVTTAAGQRVRVPDVRPLGLEQVRRFVRLPTNSNEQQLAWETRGLNVEPLPGGFSSNSPSMEIVRTCQVIGETFEATLKSVEKGAARPRVRLAAIRFNSEDGRTGYGTATFDLEPGGATAFVLDLPAEYRLLHVAVNDAPAALKQTAPNQWSISGGAPNLPQRIEAVFAIERPALGDDPTARTWLAPALVGFSVDQTLWSVIGSRESTAAGDRQMRAISPLEGELIQLESAAGMLESAAGLLTDETEEQIARVYTPWARQLLIARAGVDRERARAGKGTVDRATDAAIRAIDEAQANLARKLGMRQILADLSSQRSIASGPNEIWQSAGRLDGAPTIFSMAGASGSLTLAAVPSAADGLAERLLIGALIAAAIVGLGWFGGRSAAREAAVRWPHFIAVLAGIGWWLLLSPSIVGWGIVAVSLGHALRGTWKRRGRSAAAASPPPRRGSSVVTSLTATQHFGPDPD